MHDERSGSRHLHLSGGFNFRDMGGYLAGDGRRVRWELLYRSGSLHALTNEDLEHIRGVGIRYAYDLRSNTERRNRPNRLACIPDIAYWYHDHERSRGDLSRLLKQPDAGPAQAREVMLAIYRKLPYDLLDSYRELFRKLSAGEFPLVFNCAAGKDRTGVAAALVLTALQVPYETIVADYLLTQNYAAQICELVFGKESAPTVAGMSETVWGPLIHTDRDYLDATFAQLADDHGSAEEFLRDQLGVDARVSARLRDNLLD